MQGIEKEAGNSEMGLLCDGWVPVLTKDASYAIKKKSELGSKGSKVK